MIIRTEKPDDFLAVENVVERAFGRIDEARLVARLRADGDSVFSLVSVAGSLIVGHVTFSRMVAPFRSLALAPLCVAPEFQRRGIGRSLVEEGLKQAKHQQWDAVFVLGGPDYYQRFGFSVDLAQGFSSPYAGPHFMALSLSGRSLSGGKLEHARAFASLR
jgi:putative acetyltransferase